MDFGGADRGFKEGPGTLSICAERTRKPAEGLAQLNITCADPLNL